VNKYICFVVVLALYPSSVSSKCKPGYQSANVVKVLSVSPGASAPARVDEKEPSLNRKIRTSARFVIFDAGGKQYGLRLPASVGPHDVQIAAGQEVCFRKEGKTIRVLTSDGRPLPGVAHPIRQVPLSQ
jgi:hypothetical protein